jgi:hypothetical protein
MADQKQDKAPSTKATGDLGAAEVQAKVDEANEQGFYGVEVDQTPNENYTLQGQGKGLPTPETDEETARKARA